MKQLFLFDSYGFTGLKDFIIQDERKIMNKVLYGVKKFNKKDNIVTLISLKFSINSYQNLNHTEILELSSTAAELFHLISEFANVNNKKMKSHFITLFKSQFLILAAYFF